MWCLVFFATFLVAHVMCFFVSSFVVFVCFVLFRFVSLHFVVLLSGRRWTFHYFTEYEHPKENRPFAAGAHMVQNPKYWRAKEYDKTPLGNVNKEKSHFCC